MIFKHFIAVNCHKFHNTDHILAHLPALNIAIQNFKDSTDDPITVRFFWYSADCLPNDIRSYLDHMGCQVIQGHYAENGTNLNAQIDTAITEGFTYFYRVDGDDAVDPDRFILQAQHFNDTHVDISGGGLVYHTPGIPDYEVIPARKPTIRAYLENTFMLHPTVAFRLNSFAEKNIRYWTNRLEDKALVLEATQAGLSIENLPHILGTYNVNLLARNNFHAKWTGLKLNLRFLFTKRKVHWCIYAIALFGLQIIIGTHRVRGIRNKLLATPATHGTTSVKTPNA